MKAHAYRERRDAHVRPQTLKNEQARNGGLGENHSQRTKPQRTWRAARAQRHLIANTLTRRRNQIETDRWFITFEVNGGRQERQEGFACFEDAYAAKQQYRAEGADYVGGPFPYEDFPVAGRMNR